MVGKPPVPDTTGELRLGVELRAGAPVIADQFHRGALKVMRPRRLGPTCLGLTVVNPGGGFLAGDRYRTEVCVGAGAALELAGQSATKVYRSTESVTRQVIGLHAGPDALLDHRPEPLILFQDAAYDQMLHVQADATATVILEDIVTAGWSPDGRTHSWRSFRSRTTVTIGGRRTLTDVLVLGPADRDPATAALLRPPAALGTPAASHLGTLVLTGPVALRQLDAIRDVLADATGLRAGASTCGDAVVVRALAGGTPPLQAVFTRCADLVRTAAGVPPREHHQW